MSFGPYLPYPPDRYHGENGESSGWLRPADGPHDMVSPTSSADYLATGADTNGDFGLYRWNMGSKPSGPGNHFHRSISESFFVISGTVRLFDGAGWHDGRPGDFYHVPPGGLHAFRNESGEPASMLILFVPGAPREGYFEGLAELANTGMKPTDEEMAEFYLRHDTFWT